MGVNKCLYMGSFFAGRTELFAFFCNAAHGGDKKNESSCLGLREAGALPFPYRDGLLFAGVPDQRAIFMLLFSVRTM